MASLPSRNRAATTLTDTRTCDCPDFQRHGGPCKHIGAVRLHVARVRAEQAQKGVIAAA